MMQWQRTLPNQQLIDGLLLIAIVLLGFSLIINQPLLALFVGPLAVYIRLLKFYNRHIGTHLKLDNPRQTLRLFTGETVRVTFNLQNYAVIPYPEGMLSFEASSHVVNDTYLNTYDSNWSEYKVPVMLTGNGQTAVTIPFEANRRGVMRIRNLRYTFTHPLTFQPVILIFKGSFNTKAMIYPDMESVYTAKRDPVQYLGSQASRHALFEDLLQPIGTREALLSDSFKHIHWKASAKQQTLQTKVYQPNQHIAWSIIVSISKTSRLGNTYVSEHYETYLSQAAFLAKQLISQGEPVELFINCSTLSGPFHVPEGSDITHLKKMLEALALVSTSGLFPMNRILHSIATHRLQSQMLILLGNYNTVDQNQIHTLLAKGHPIYQVRHSVLHPYSVQGSGTIEA